jgi:hypothetical protein
MEVLDHLCPCAGAGVVRFVDDQQLEEIPRQQVQPAGKRLHTGNLHRMA